MADVSILLLCTPQSVESIFDKLVKYFIYAYSVSEEFAVTITQYCILKDKDIFDGARQLDGLTYYRDDKRLAGPPNRSSKTYQKLQSAVKRGGAHVNIRIGSSATKDDIIWYINHFWDSEIAPMRNLKHEESPQKSKPKLLRDRTIYALRRNGWSYPNIQNHIQRYYDDFVEETALRKIYERAKPNDSQFDPIYQKIMTFSDEKIFSRKCEIKYNALPKPHFLIV